MDFRELIKETDGFISRFLNRRISFRITRFIIDHNIELSPNQVSIISCILGVFSAFFFIFNLPVLGGIGVQISSIIDGVDGELARLKGLSSKFGGFFDAILDRIVDIITLICVFIYISSIYGENVLINIFCFLALSGDLMVSYIHARGEASLHTHPALLGIKCFISRDVRLFLIFLFSLFELIFQGIVLFAVIIIAFLSYLYIFIKVFDAYKFRSRYE